MKIDAKAKKIILKKYWKSGWRPEEQRIVAENDLIYLKERKLFFESCKISHDKLIQKIKFLSNDIKLLECYNLFNCSLLDNNELNRSFLSSVLQAKQMPEHSHCNEKMRCDICGEFGFLNIDFDILFFEKLMWGGVRLDNIGYIYFDLILFREFNEKINGNDQLVKVLKEIEGFSDNLSASKVANLLKIQKSNKAQREIICDILGICDVLTDKKHLGYLFKYKNSRDRELPNQHFVDLAYPFCWYNSKFKVNWESLDKIKMM